MAIDFLEAHLRYVLNADATVAGLVGGPDNGGVSSRIYFTDIKQGSPAPYISMFEVSGNRTHTLKGPDGFKSARIQMDLWAVTLTAAKGLFTAVRLVLDGYHGTQDSHNIASVTMNDERAFYESDPKLHRISCDMMIWHREPVAVRA